MFTDYDIDTLLQAADDAQHKAPSDDCEWADLYEPMN